MRVVLLAIVCLAAAAGGCGEPTARTVRPASTAEDLASLPRIARAGAVAMPVAPTTTEPALSAPPPLAAAAPLVRAPVERPLALRRFFDALARLEDGRALSDVRIAQYGDSHTAADLGTGAARRALQSRFGNGGRGFVAIGKPYASYYLQDGVRCGMSAQWAAARGKIENGQTTGDGCYGLAGASIVASRRGASAWADVTASASQIEVAYLEQPRGGTFELLVDGARAARIATKRVSPASAFRAVTVPDGPHRIEVRALGDGEVRVFGASLERPELGVVFDALGINGARITTTLAWSERHVTEQLRHRAPDLVILAYGTNEAGDDTEPELYARQLVEALGRVARAVPTASCLLLGPPDRAISSGLGWETAPRLAEIVDTQRRVAEAAGCAFYDQQAAMGGPGSIVQWAAETPPRAQRDHVHLTREGYAQLGTAFAADLLAAYTATMGEKR